MSTAKVSAVFRDKEVIEEITTILQLNPELRSREQENALVKFIGQTGIFTKAENIESIERLAREVKLSILIDGEYVFRQAELGECFFVILSGSVVGLAKSEEYDEYG